MPIDTFLNLLKNIVDKNKPLLYKGFSGINFTIDSIIIYKNIAYLHADTLNKLSVRNIAVFLLNNERVNIVRLDAPIGDFRDIKDVSNSGHLYV